MRDRLGATQQIGNTHVNNVESAAEQREIRIRFVAEELAVPDPRVSGRGLPRRHDERGLSVQVEIVTIKAVPERASAGELQVGERVNLSVDLFGLRLSFGQGLAFVHAGTVVTDQGKPGILEQTLALLNQVEYRGAIGM